MGQKGEIPPVEIVPMIISEEEEEQSEEMKETMQQSVAADGGNIRDPASYPLSMGQKGEIPPVDSQEKIVKDLVQKIILEEEQSEEMKETMQQSVAADGGNIRGPARVAFASSPRHRADPPSISQKVPLDNDKRRKRMLEIEGRMQALRWFVDQRDKLSRRR